MVLKEQNYGQKQRKVNFASWSRGPRSGRRSSVTCSGACTRTVNRAKKSRLQALLDCGFGPQRDARPEKANDFAICNRGTRKRLLQRKMRGPPALSPFARSESPSACKGRLQDGRRL